MAITTYAELKTAINAWAGRTDLTAMQDEILDMAESVIKRAPEPRNSQLMGGIRANKTRATGTFTVSDATLSLPTGYLEADKFRYTDATGGELEYRSPPQLGALFKTGGGRPKYFTIEDKIEFDVAPDSAYAYEFSYWPVITALDGTNTTNWLLTNFPDAYLAACLYFVGQYTKDIEMTTIWATAYREAAYAINKSYRRGRQFQGPLQITVDSATP